MAKMKHGDGLCDRCGRNVVWRRSDSGALSYFCQHCDFQGYAKAGTEASRLVDEELNKAAPDTRPAPAPASRPAAQPAAPKGAGLLIG